MNDPNRWLDKPNELLSLEQRLLKSGKNLKPPARAVDQGWSDFCALVGPFTGGVDHSGSAHSGGSASSAAGAKNALTQSTSLGKLGLAQLAGTVTKAGVTKLTIAAVVACGSLFVIGNQLAARQKAATVDPIANSQVDNSLRPQTELPSPQTLPAAAVPNAAVSSLPLNSPRTAANRDAVALQPEPTSPPTEPPTYNGNSPGGAEPIGTAVMPNLEDRPAPFGKFPSNEPARLNELKAEATAIAQAKNLMNGGQFQAALSLLALVAQRFPAGVLAPEREALTIEALAGAGAMPLAQQRAARFLTQYPQSPLSNKIRNIARLK
jgi:hypothetical protein